MPNTSFLHSIGSLPTKTVGSLLVNWSGRLTVIWFLVNVPVLSVANSVNYKLRQLEIYGNDALYIYRAYREDMSEAYQPSKGNIPKVSTPCKSFTKTFCLAILFAAIDNRRVTTEGNPWGTNATRTETANVTV